MKYRYNALYALLTRYRPRTILEIGTYNGKNAVKMISVAKPEFYFGFDLFEDITKEQMVSEHSKPGIGLFESAQHRISKVLKEFQLIRGNTHDTLRTFRTSKAINFIFIDGGHSLPTIKNDWHFCSKFMRRNTITVMDDYYPQTEKFGCKKLVQGLNRELYKVEPMYPVDLNANKQTVQMVKITKCN